MDRVTEKLAVKGSKERVIQLISRKVGKESKKKIFKRRNWSIKKCESNNDTITEELVSSSGNIPIQLVSQGSSQIHSDYIIAIDDG